MKQSMKSLLAAVVLVSVSAAASAQNVVKATFVEGTKPDGREGAAKVADGRKSTKWCIDEPNQMPYYVILSAGEQPIQLQEYIFTTADDTDMYPERNPCSWTVYGSNDKTNWKVVDEKHSNLRMGDLNEQELAMCKIYAIALGYEPQTVEKMLVDIASRIKTKR